MDLNNFNKNSHPHTASSNYSFDSTSCYSLDEQLLSANKFYKAEDLHNQNSLSYTARDLISHTNFIKPAKFQTQNSGRAYMINDKGECIRLPEEEELKARRSLTIASGFHFSNMDQNLYKTEPFKITDSLITATSTPQVIPSHSINNFHSATTTKELSPHLFGVNQNLKNPITPVEMKKSFTEFHKATMDVGGAGDAVTTLPARATEEVNFNFLTQTEATVVIEEDDEPDDDDPFCDTKSLQSVKSSVLFECEKEVEAPPFSDEKFDEIFNSIETIVSHSYSVNKEDLKTCLKPKKSDANVEMRTTNIEQPSDEAIKSVDLEYSSQVIWKNLHSRTKLVDKIHQAFTAIVTDFTQTLISGPVCPIPEQFDAEIQTNIACQTREAFGLTSFLICFYEKHPKVVGWFLLILVLVILCIFFFSFMKYSIFKHGFLYQIGLAAKPLKKANSWWFYIMRN